MENFINSPMSFDKEMSAKNYNCNKNSEENKEDSPLNDSKEG